MLRKWFYKMCMRAQADFNSGRYNENTKSADCGATPYGLTPKVRSIPDELNTCDAPTTVFRVVKAIGGSIIEARRYDPKTERQNTNLYLVQDGEDLTESLGKVMTMEALR